ncbi:MAG: thioredoxin [Candidatus Marinimicrobia bacterium CG08_land_8_20_14_0_20_45_22]|nr:MAG: thioredoxin [Candidatus Marinimicrobia bacterium CG08_land_8_20_14_0_20_45_22]
MIVITESNFEAEVLKSNIPVLVDFWATWCAPCLKIEPIVEELSKQYAGKIKFGKLNVEEHPMIPPRFGIRSIPALLLFKNGAVFSQITGSQPKRTLESRLMESI